MFCKYHHGKAKYEKTSPKQKTNPSPRIIWRELLDHFPTNRGEHKTYLKFRHLGFLSSFFRASGVIVPSSATAMQLPEMPKRHSWRALWSTGAVEKTIERYIWANYYKNWFIQTWFGITQLYSWICFRCLERSQNLGPSKFWLVRTATLVATVCSDHLVVVQAASSAQPRISLSMNSKMQRCS